jgi:hypothetical protein
MSERLAIPLRRNHLTQKVRVSGRTLYIFVDDYSSPVGLYSYL